jgi:hypothetical protein
MLLYNQHNKQSIDEADGDGDDDHDHDSNLDLTVLIPHKVCD